MMILGTQFLIPFLTKMTGVETIIWWFVVAGVGIFVPLLIAAIIILKTEGYPINIETWKTRLRFKKMNSGDWLWSIVGIIVIGALSYIIMEMITKLSGPVDHQPPFMNFEPLNTGRYWILVVWFPYWLFNIMGEEVLWRGVLLPKQEIVFGKYTWIIQGIGWGLFHIAFGWQLLITLLPILFILPYITQKRKNSWIGVFLHAVLNGPSFIAISLGLI